MKFSKTVPTLPMPVRGKPKGSGWFSVFVGGEWSPPQYRSADFPWRHDIEWHVELCIEGPRIEFPQVPDEVLGAVRRFEKDYASNRPTNCGDALKLCDFIKSLAPLDCRTQGACHAMTDAKPLSAEELGDFLFEYPCVANVRECDYQRLLATLRRRDELIRHQFELDMLHDDSCEHCREIYAIVEAGDG